MSHKLKFKKCTTQPPIPKKIAIRKLAIELLKHPTQPTPDSETVYEKACSLCELKFHDLSRFMLHVRDHKDDTNEV